MSLDWNVEKVENYEEILAEDERRTTKSLIWATMAIGMNKIDETTWPDFYMRVNIWESAFGAFTIKGNPATRGFDPVYVTPEQVKRRIGLYTNASRLSRTKFRDKVFAQLERNAEGELPR